MPDGGPTNPQILARASAGKSLPGTIGRTANDALNLVTGFKLSGTSSGVKVSPLVVGYAAPHAYGGAVPNSAYGLPDYQGVLTLPYVLFTPEGQRQNMRGQRLLTEERRRDHQRNLAANAQGLSNVELLSRLRTITEPYQRGGAAANSAQVLAAEVRRRGLTGEIAHTGVLFGPNLTVEQLLGRVPDGTGHKLVSADPRDAEGLLPALQALNPADP